MAFFYVCKMLKIHHKKNSVTSFIFILSFQKNWGRFIKISNIKLKKFSNKIDVGIVYVFNVGIFLIIFKFLLVRNSLFFFQIWDLNFLTILFCCVIFFEFALFSFPIRIAKLGKFETKQNMFVVGRGGGFNYLTKNSEDLNNLFLKIKNVKYILTL